MPIAVTRLVLGLALLVGLLATIVLTTFGTPAPTYAQPDARDVATLVAEYLDSATSDERRAAIVDLLRDARGSHTGRELRPVLDRDEEDVDLNVRRRAMHLLGVLGHEDAWRLLEPWMTSMVFGEDAIQALIAANTEEAWEGLLETWEESIEDDENPELFPMLTRAFIAADLQLTQIDFLLETLEPRRETAVTTERADAARRILVAQFSMDQSADAEAIRAEYERLLPRLESLESEFRFTGEQLLPRVTLPDGGTVNGQILVLDDSQAAQVPISEGWQAEDHEIRVRIRPLSPASEETQAEIGYRAMLDGTKYLSFIGDKLQVHQRDNSVQQFDFPQDRWSEVVYRVTVTNRAARQRQVAVIYNGRTVFGGDPFSGDLREFYVASRSMSVAVGGWEYVPD